MGFALVACPGATAPEASGRSSGPVASAPTAPSTAGPSETRPSDASGGPGPSAGARPAEAPVVKSTSCPTGPMTYLGFRGQGRPSPTLVREIKSRFPDAIVVEVGDG